MHNKCVKPVQCWLGFYAIISITIYFAIDVEDMEKIHIKVIYKREEAVSCPLDKTSFGLASPALAAADLPEPSLQGGRRERGRGTHNEGMNGGGGGLSGVDAVFPQPLSRLHSRATENISPARRRRLQGASSRRYRTQPVTIEEIKVQASVFSIVRLVFCIFLLEWGSSIRVSAVWIMGACQAVS